MNAIITHYKKAVLSVMLLVGMSMSAAEPAKCACQGQKTVRDATTAEISTADKPVAGEQELDVSELDVVKCGPCQAAAAAREAARKSIQDASIQAALAAASAIAKRMELDMSAPQKKFRAPREELVNPCNPCDICMDEIPCPSDEINEVNCCDVVNQIACDLQLQGREARKCCKKIKRELKEIEELVESQIDQSAACCSIIETTLGDPGNSVIDIPSCAQRFSIVDVIDSTNVDVITWLKSLYVLLFQVYQCTCHPCIEG